jgi:hypothetical protein
MVGSTERKQGNFFEACVFCEILSMPRGFLHDGSLPERSCDHTRLTKTAAARATAHDLDQYPFINRFELFGTRKCVTGFGSFFTMRLIT